MPRGVLDDGPALTRSKLLSKSKALSTARSVVRSQLGSAVIRNSTQESTVHQLELFRIDAELCRRLRQLDRSRRQFVTACRRAPEPMLIVHRPPLIALPDIDPEAASGGWRRRASPNDSFDEPGYMKPTLGTVQSAPVIPTIEAFRTLNTRSSSKGVITSKDAKSAPPVRFRSTVLPSWPLTEEDQCELRVHRRRHWLRLRRDVGARRSTEHISAPCIS